MNTGTTASSSILVATCLLLLPCSYRYDRVTFKAVGIMPATSNPVPHIAIDTNQSMGTMGDQIHADIVANQRAMPIFVEAKGNSTGSVTSVPVE
jgi:hypothetical protein